MVDLRSRQCAQPANRRLSICGLERIPVLGVGLQSAHIDPHREVILGTGGRVPVRDDVPKVGITGHGPT